MKRLPIWFRSAPKRWTAWYRGAIICCGLSSTAGDGMMIVRFEGRRRSNKGDHGKLGRFLFETGYSFYTSYTAVISSLNKVSGRMMHFVFNWSRPDRKIESTVTRFCSEAIYIYRVFGKGSKNIWLSASFCVCDNYADSLTITNVYNVIAICFYNGSNLGPKSRIDYFYYFIVYYYLLVVSQMIYL